MPSAADDRLAGDRPDLRCSTIGDQVPRDARAVRRLQLERSRSFRPVSSKQFIEPPY